VLTAVKLQAPLLNLDTEESQLEEQHMTQTLLNYQTYNGNTPGTVQAKVDELGVHLIAKACKADRQFRALDVSTMLGLRKSINIACMLASKLKKPILAERVNLLMEAKFPGGRAQVQTETALVPQNVGFGYSESASDRKTEFTDKRNGLAMLQRTGGKGGGKKKTSQAGLFGAKKKTTPAKKGKSTFKTATKKRKTLDTPPSKASSSSNGTSSGASVTKAKKLTKTSDASAAAASSAAAKKTAPVAVEKPKVRNPFAK
jgi:hypothetical protein